MIKRQRRKWFQGFSRSLPNHGRDGVEAVPQQGIDSAPSLPSRCLHDVETACQLCAIAGDEERRLRSCPAPMYLEPAEHAEMVLQALSDANRFGHLPHQELTDLYAELCAHSGIEPLARHIILREIGHRLKRERRKIRDRNDPRDTGTCYFHPRPKDAVVPFVKRRDSR